MSDDYVTFGKITALSANLLVTLNINIVKAHIMSSRHASALKCYGCCVVTHICTFNIVFMANRRTVFSFTAGFHSNNCSNIRK